MTARSCGAILEIPPLLAWISNLGPSSGPETVSGGQFDWGGRLLNCNGGVQRFPQVDWKPTVECKSIRELNCKTDRSSRCESRF